MLVQQLNNQPIVVIKPNNMRNMRGTFHHITYLTSGIYGQDFVIYDFTGMNPTLDEFEQWICAQSYGLRGSITDGTTFTLLVGTHDLLPDVVEEFEYNGVYVALYDHMHEALHHAKTATRIFAAW